MAGGGSHMDYNHAERLLWQDAPAILSQIGLRPGDTLADIGSGDGYFSIPAARMVGKTGKVYALDVSAENHLRAQSRRLSGRARQYPNHRRRG